MSVMLVPQNRGEMVELLNSVMFSSSTRLVRLSSMLGKRAAAASRLAMVS